MSDGPISHWWKSHQPPKVSTDPKSATHFVGGTWPRAYCGHRGGTQTGEPRLVDCSACITALRADAEASP